MNTIMRERSFLIIDQINNDASSSVRESVFFFYLKEININEEIDYSLKNKSILIK